MSDDMLNYDEPPRPALLPLPPPRRNEKIAKHKSNSAESKSKNDPKNDKPRVDHYGLLVLDKPQSQEEVLYQVQEKSKHRPTRALFVGNLRRPLNAISFQNHLRKLLQDIDSSYTIDRAWMNRTRTHAIVLASHVAAAEALRAALNGELYPSESERNELLQEYLERETARNEKPLRELDSIKQHDMFVDYMLVGDISTWIFEEDSGPKNGKWRVEYRRQGEFGDVGAEHLLLEGDFRPQLPEKERKGFEKNPNKRRRKEVETDKDRNTTRMKDRNRNDGNDRNANENNQTKKHTSYNRTESDTQDSERSSRGAYLRTYRARLRSRSPVF